MKYGGVGCHYSDNWAVASYDIVQDKNNLGRNSLLEGPIDLSKMQAQLRSVVDPWVIAQELTAGSLNFGETPGDERVLGIVFLCLGFIMMLPCCIGIVQVYTYSKDQHVVIVTEQGTECLEEGTWSQTSLDKQVTAKLTEMFKLHDIDGDGFVSLDECLIIDKLIAEATEADWDEDRSRDGFTAYDTNKDSKLSLDEFVTGAKSQFEDALRPAHESTQGHVPRCESEKKQLAECDNIIELLRAARQTNGTGELTVVV
jgi:hypothetical protein